jgi:hypothetical protein
MEKDIVLYKLKDIELKKYYISKCGKIWSKKSNQFMKLRICNGYYMINIGDKSYMVHRLVASRFIPNPLDKPYVNHINSNKLDNRVENLEWVTQKENTAAHGKQTSHPRRVVQIDDNNKVIATYNSLIEASKSINLSPSAISKVLIGQNETAGNYKWKYEDTTNYPDEIDLTNAKYIDIYSNYMVLQDGRIYNTIRRKLVKPIMNASGYCYVSLCTGGIKQNLYVHRIVAVHFIPNNENKTQVNHKNKIRHDNRVENLEWVTASENSKHAISI